MSIHEKINARSWYDGELHPTDLLLCGEKDGVQTFTPTRIRIFAPYLVDELKKDRPRTKGKFYQIVESYRVVERARFLARLFSYS